jgi:hypothetical protein
MVSLFLHYGLSLCRPLRSLSLAAGAEPGGSVRGGRGAPDAV